MEEREAGGMAEIALFTEAVGGKVMAGIERTEVLGVKVAEEELAEATPARRREIEAIVNCIVMELFWRSTVCSTQLLSLPLSLISCVWTIITLRYAILEPSQSSLWIHSISNNLQTFVSNIEGLVPSCASQIADSKQKLMEAYELATEEYDY